MKQHQSIDAINKSYHKHTPESKIKFVSLTKQAQHSISISLIFAVILCVSAVQVVLHYRLNQQAALQRLSQYHLSRLKLSTSPIINIHPESKIKFVSLTNKHNTPFQSA